LLVVLTTVLRYRVHCDVEYGAIFFWTRCIALIIILLLLLVTARWYRFTSPMSDRIHNGCVKPGHCGTQWPIWMNGRHPTGND